VAEVKSNRAGMRSSTLIEDLKLDADFCKDWQWFASLCRLPVPALEAFKSWDDYEAYVEDQRRERKNGSPASFQSLAGDLVRSIEELRIANWLWLNGVPYRYEECFSPVPDGWSKYEPDFYYPDIETWHEHFALDARGKAPAYFENPVQYAAQATQKE
jgi:DNA helicase-4